MADLSWLRTLGRNRPPTQANITVTTDPTSASSNYIEIANAPPIHTPTPELLSPPTPPSRTPDSSPSKHRFRSFESLRRVSSNILNSGGTSNINDKHGHNHSHSYSPFSFPSNRNNQPPQRASSSLWTPAPIGALPLGELDPDEDKDGGLRRVLIGRRGEASTWHNPNLMQMVETLRAVMIRKHDALESIPIVYNSYVLSLIEGFAHINQRLESCLAELDELKRAREMELEQFRGISEEWMEREEAYKAEIKRLELVLAKESKDGVASVALARHESLVDRSGTKRFKARLERMSNSHEKDWKAEDIAGSYDLTTPTCSSVPRNQYSVIAELPRRMGQDRDVWMSRAVERQERNTQRSPPQHWRRQHRQETSAHAADDPVSPAGTRQRRPRHPVEDQSPERQERLITSGNRRAKTAFTVPSRQPQERANDQQRLRGESPPLLNKYSWDDAESSTSGSSIAATEEESLTQSGMDGTAENMLKVQRGQVPNDSGCQQEAARVAMATEEAGRSFFDTSQGSSSGWQQRRQNRLTVIKSLKAGSAGTEVPWESGEGCASANANANANIGANPIIQDRRGGSEINVNAEARCNAGNEASADHQGAQQALGPRGSASTRRRSVRTYSFDKGDDEVLPVTSPGDLSCPRQVQVQEATSERGRRPTVAPSTSTRSVVWVGKDEAVTDTGRREGGGVGGGGGIGDSGGGRSSAVVMIVASPPSLSPSSSSPNLQAASASPGGGNAARIAAERAVARQNGGGGGGGGTK
ncbi:hypothetical protein QBC44DRAFT_379171 [Cladorrhinum sp. PSN332]|nr:hypothetical protein QBC44DRAFT_379171 [Cladorrhinum sp. PSN332]